MTQRSTEQGSTMRSAKWALGLALVAALTLTLVSLQLFQFTSESASRPALRRALNALVEGDAIIERNYPDLRARAEAAQPDDVLELRDYPISIPLTRDEVLASDEKSLRSLLLDRGVERMYDEGTGVLRDGSSGAGGRFTAAGVVDESLGFLRSPVHGILAAVTLVLAGISALAASALVAVCRGFGRPLAAGVALTLASLPLVIGGLVMRAYASAAADADGEYLRSELMDVVASLAWAPLRNGLALTATGAAIVVIAAAGARLARDEQRTV
jgi:hypothetical protein